MKDPETGKPLVDLVLDKAGQKGTGKWTAQVALDLGVPIPTIAAAIDARVLSSMKDERVAASKHARGPDRAPPAATRRRWSQAVHDALLRGEDLLVRAGHARSSRRLDEYKWNINLAEMARIWKGGCIIRARLLDDIMRAYERAARTLPNLLLDEDVRGRGATTRRPRGARWSRWRRRCGIPVPALSASLAYFDSYRTAELPQNLTQAQRDAFGAHTYERTDAGATRRRAHRVAQELTRANAARKAGGVTTVVASTTKSRAA